jgi:NAD(P)-dependent dehydrogenase (short-subunit alcohol dehydrogenase family)
MDLRLSGKRALVTGSNDGLGKAIAATLLGEGVDVAINGRDRDKLAAAAQELTAGSDRKVVTVGGDVSSRDEVQRIVDEAAAALGGLDILVNSVPAPSFGPFLDHADEDWGRAMETKFIGYVRTMRAAIPHLQRAGGGVILSNIGAGGKTYYANHLVGGSTNAALMLLTTGLAVELGPLHIRVVGINAGAVRTTRYDNLQRSRAVSENRPVEELERETVAGIPTGAMARPQDIADLAVFLVSDRARQINGTIVTIDGGMIKTL